MSATDGKPVKVALVGCGDIGILRAKALAGKVAKENSADAVAAALYQRTFGRPPTNEDRETVTTFLHEPTQRYSGSPEEARKRALADLCHALLNANEFLFVD